METGIGFIRDLEVSVGHMNIERWDEPQGPTPFPTITTFRNWDRQLLSRYKPFYMPFCDLCCLCTFGKCDLTGTKRGACGITMAAQQSRIVLLASCIGAATHVSHAHELVSELIKRFGPDFRLDPGGLSVGVEAPLIRLVCGLKPETLSDLETVVSYLEREVTSLLSATHTGQEGDPLDLESKVFHSGMIDHVGLEVADIAQISGFNFPKADPDAPLIRLGVKGIDTKKPVILVIGHNVTPSVSIMEYLKEFHSADSAEVTGICCSAIDLSRNNKKARIIGPISWQMRYIRSGIPDVIVVDEQCIRTDVINEAGAVNTRVIATSEKNCIGLPDRTNDTAESIINDLVSNKLPGVLILDPLKSAQVAVETSLRIFEERRRTHRPFSEAEANEAALNCTGCMECVRSCPNELPIPDTIQSFRDGNPVNLRELLDLCNGCIRCEQACPKGIPVHRLIVYSGWEKLNNEQFTVRAGRGAIQDTEIRTVGGPLVLGEIPGIIAFVGCANYPNGGEEVARMAVEFAHRKYIVCTSGCSAITIGMYHDEDGKTPYEAYSGKFDAGCILNVGSCVSNAHISGAAVKIANIFAKRNLRGNYEEIADYVHNRVGAVGIAWGAMSQKAAAIAAGFWRLGIPVIVGPQGTKYRRMLLGRGDIDSDWTVMDSRTGEEVYTGPVPEHLFYAAETEEEAMMMAAKLCMRPNDTGKGRIIKITHYIDLYRKLYGKIPDDIYRFIRKKGDIPLTLKDSIEENLKMHNWKESPIPDPTRIRSYEGKSGESKR